VRIHPKYRDPKELFVMPISVMEKFVEGEKDTGLFVDSKNEEQYRLAKILEKELGLKFHYEN